MVKHPENVPREWMSGTLIILGNVSEKWDGIQILWNAPGEWNDIPGESKSGGESGPGNYTTLELLRKTSKSRKLETMD